MADLIHLRAVPPETHEPNGSRDVTRRGWYWVRSVGPGVHLWECVDCRAQLVHGLDLPACSLCAITGGRP